MSQDSPPGQSNDEVCLGLSFQGLQISVKGPSSKALTFIKRITEDLQDFSTTASTSSSNPPSSSTPAVPICPPAVLSLANKLSAASILTPEERVRRAWAIGLAARRQIEEGTVSEEPVVDIDLPNNHFAIVRSQVFGEGPRIIRSAADFKKILGTRCSPPPVGHGFPSGTEARIYVAAANQGSLEDL